MNYTLKELKEDVDRLIKFQGENAHCAAWIYTAEDCTIEDVDAQTIDYVAVDNPILSRRILNEVGNMDCIYQVIHECLDEVTEEEYILYQQELV